ncbi:hypothetical protein OSTOST_20381 [Ostertagia ostertagi]
MYIAEQGGRHALSTKAAGDETESYTADLVKPVIKELQTQITTIIANETAPAQLNTYSSKTSESVTNYNLSRLGDKEADRKVFAAPNKGIPAVLVATETTEKGVISTTVLRRDDSVHQEAILVDEKRYGGAVQLSTKSASDVSSTMGGTLLCPRPTDLSAQKVVIIGNSVSPIKLNTLASIEEIRVVEKEWTRPAPQYTVARKLDAPNTDSSVVTLREAGDNHETTNCAYNRDYDEEQVARTMNEKRNGGAVALNTKYSRECSSESDDTLVATPTLSTFASSTEIQTVNEVWNKPDSREEQTIILKKANIGEHTMMTAGETSDVIENIIIQLHRKSERADSALTRFIPYTIEPTAVSTKSSEESYVSIDSSLQSMETFEMDASIVITDRNTAESPSLYCGCSKEASTSGVFNLSRLGDTQTVREMKEAANRGPSIAVEMRESTLVSEITTLVYERDESTAFISETILIPREGGKYLLSTGHASEETARIDNDWTKKRVDVLEANITKVLRNEEGPIELFASATEDSAVGVTSQLQKSSQVEATMTKRDAPHTWENQL